MKLKVFLVNIIMLCFLLYACGGDRTYVYIREVSSYAEKIIPVQIPLRMEIGCTNADIDVYGWNQKNVGFEMTERIRGNGTEEELKKYFAGFTVSYGSADGIVRMNSGFRGDGRSMAGSIDIKLYIPKKVASLKYDMDSGKLNFLDDLDCELIIAGGGLDLKINRFEGKIAVNVKSGGLRISDGMIKSGSAVKTGRGNIKIKAEFEASGDYSFETREGVIELMLPGSLKALFSAFGRFEADEFDPGDSPAKFRLVCGAGEIKVKKQ